MTVPNHLYRNAGIRINTPGLVPISGCTPIGNGFCTFTVSNSSAANIEIGNLAKLYGVTGLAGAFENTLYTIDTNTAFPTFVMPLNSNGDGSILGSDGTTLYHWTINLFESMDLQALTTTSIPITGPSFSEPYGAVWFNSTGAFLLQKRSSQQWMTITTGGNTAVLANNSRRRGFACYQHRIYGVEQQGSELNELNPANGAILSTVPLSVPGHTIENALGLTVDPNTGVFYALLKLDSNDIRTLVTLDINTGVGTIIGDIDEGSGIFISSITFHPADSTC